MIRCSALDGAHGHQRLAGYHRTQGRMLLHTCVSPHAAHGQVGGGGSLRTPHMDGHDNSGSTEPLDPKALDKCPPTGAQYTESAQRTPSRTCRSMTLSGTAARVHLQPR